MIFTASMRFAMLASSHLPARISALTTATCVLGYLSAQPRVTPNTFSGLFFQIW